VFFSKLKKTKLLNTNMLVGWLVGWLVDWLYNDYIMII